MKRIGVFALALFGLLSGVLSLFGAGKMKSIGISVLALIGLLIAIIFANHDRFAASAVFSVVFSTMIVLLLYDVYTTKMSVVREWATISGAGIIFVLGYALIYSVIGPVADCETGRCAVSFSESVYFSIVTATTLGYGDFAPAVQARYIAAFQAVTGYVFLGVVLAVAVKSD